MVAVDDSISIRLFANPRVERGCVGDQPQKLANQL